MTARTKRNNRIAVTRYEKPTEDEREDAHEGEDREDDPDDAVAQAPTVQPLRGANLLTLDAHARASSEDRMPRERIFPRSTRSLGGATHFGMNRVLSSWIVSFRARSTSAIMSTACLMLRWFAAIPQSPSMTRATAIDSAKAPPATAPDAFWIASWIPGTSTRTPIVRPTIRSIVQKTVRTMRRPTRAWELTVMEATSPQFEDARRPR